MSASAVGGVAVILLSHVHGYERPLPKFVYLLDAFYSVAVLAGMRLASRVLFGLARRSPRQGERKRVLIYGADESGVSVLSELRRHCHEYRAVGFLDDRPEIQGVSLSGLRVLGSEGEVARLAKKYHVHQILFSSHPHSRARRRALMQICFEEKLDFRLVTNISEEVDLPRRRVLPELVIEDLLGRKPIVLDTSRSPAGLPDRWSW